MKTTLSQALGQTVRHPDGQRHEVRRLVARVPEHHPLVPGALRVESVLAAHARAELVRLVDPLGDVGGLGVEGDEHPAGVAVEAVGVVVVADRAHRVAGQGGDIDVRRGGDLPRHDDETGGQERLTGHPAGRVALEHGVEHGVGNLVRHFVGVALGH